MRANLPKTPRPTVTELEGIYLQAMKEASVRLMDALPAGEDLWGMLGQIETMLLEAQLREMPPEDLFGNGGVAAFCQSIVDEYRADGETILPASQDKSVKPDRRMKSPRGGVNYRKHRTITGILTTCAVLLLVALCLWYTGIIRYWTQGPSFYLEELYNFSSSYTETTAEPIRITIPLQKESGMSELLYADGDGYDIVLTSVETYDHAGSYTDPHTGETVNCKMTGWYLRMTYAVESDFNRITYVEPSSGGTVTVTLADGSVHTGKITWIESGSSNGNREYARISVIELPSTTNIQGATLTVVMDPPHRVEWNRISTGLR